jgi:putative FmdB family regulatory protein
MPLYTYECESCTQRFDVRQSFSDAPLTTCPECEGPIHRVIQPVGVVFKGSGFYVTDSKGKQNLIGPSKDKDAAKGSDSAKDGAKTEAAAKPADSTSDS